MEMIKIDNQLAYGEKGQGFPVILGHSYLFDHNMWQPQIDVLSQHYRVIVPELWGHGSAGSLPDTIRSLTDIAGAIAHLLDFLKIDEFALVGLSVGGMWGVELADLVKTRLKSLVLMDTFVGKEPEDSHQKYFALLAAIEEAQSVPAPLQHLITPMFFRKNADPVLVQQLNQFLATRTSEALCQTLVPLGRQIFGRADALAKLANITAPTLVMTGAEDEPRPPSEGKMMAEILHCQHLIIPNAGHISTLENPAFVNQHLLTFLQKNK